MPRKRATKATPPQRAGAVKAKATTTPTVIYIHGMLNKPPASTLKDIWDNALFGGRMGERTHMAYWADIRYPQPLGPTTAQSLEQEYAYLQTALTDEEFIEDTLARVPDNKPAQEFTRQLATSLLKKSRPKLAKALSTSEYSAQINFPDWFTRWFVRSFTPDVAAYFFDKEQRKQIQQRLRVLLTACPGPFVVIAHSQGTIVAYDVLSELAAKGIQAPLFVTLGSPLGIDEIKQRVAKPLKVPGNVTNWHNFAAKFDVVAIDRDLADEYKPKAKLTDHPIRTRGILDNPHDIVGYLGHTDVRHTVTQHLGPAFADATKSFVIAKDLAGDMQGAERRTPVLIELSADAEGNTLTEKRDNLTKELTKLTKTKDATIEPLRRYVAANLTASELLTLRGRHKTLNIRRMWRNSVKHAVLNSSTGVVHSKAAHESYGAYGKDVTWAVLDTGITANHPHFASHNNIKEQWDCTKPGAPRTGATDVFGHGTHVAGIIAGTGTQANTTYMGNAPRAGLHIYKVLDNNGRGQDSWIIKALDHIAATNDNSPDLKIHGVNLSLGGPFDPEVYGTGFSPLCNELRRLWRQGVLVVIAAGNEGRLVLNTTEGPTDLYLDLSIGDPANLEEAIAVGSVHKESPHLYGISYFSSRGPTADGRRKPDCVAPGEKIISANSEFTTGDPYIAMSGTSMACPQVSGVLAAFLSVRREFIGRPDMVKEILLNHCTDIGRDPNFQGEGIPNLMQMLLAT